MNGAGRPARSARTDRQNWAESGPSIAGRSFMRRGWREAQWTTDMPSGSKRPINPPQHQDTQPGREKPMHPAPRSSAEDYVGSGKLAGKVALIPGGDSGIGRAGAV